MNNIFKFTLCLLIIVVVINSNNNVKSTNQEETIMNEETSTIIEVSGLEDASLDEETQLDYEKLNEQCLNEGVSFLEINNNTPYFLSEEIPNEVLRNTKSLTHMEDVKQQEL